MVPQADARQANECLMRQPKPSFRPNLVGVSTVGIIFISVQVVRKDTASIELSEELD